MTKPKQLMVALQQKRAIQLLAQSLKLDDTHAMEIADIYPKFEAPKKYKEGDIVAHGENDQGETQLYRVLEDHISTVEDMPENSANYKAIGFTEDGTHIWTQPQSHLDAYEQGDVVAHEGAKYVSDIDGNVFEPGVYGWSIK